MLISGLKNEWFSDNRGMDSRYRTVNDPSPIWNLHCALWAYIRQEEAQGHEVDDDLCIVVSIEMHSYMVRYYKAPCFTIRTVPVIAENLCSSMRIHFLSRSEYDSVRGNEEYWQ